MLTTEEGKVGVLDCESLIKRADDQEAMIKDVNQGRREQQEYLTKLQEWFISPGQLHQQRLAFLGYGRAGKDMAAAWLSANFKVRYGGSTSSIVAPIVASALGVSTEEAFLRRHECRKYWFVFCNLLRKDDPTLLARMLLSQADVIVGLRSAEELDACQAESIIDLSIWIDRDVPQDFTVEFTPDDCDITVRNLGTRIQFFRKLRRIASIAGLIPR